MSEEFDALQRMQAILTAHDKTMRREHADRFRNSADDYELQTLSEPDAVKKAWLEGVAEGLRAAAAELAPEKVRV